MKPHPVKRATLKREPAATVELLLVRHEPRVFRWHAAHGVPFDNVDYVAEVDALKALRVLVESSPEYVGVDLTIHSVTPPPEERAAEKITNYINEHGNPGPLGPNNWTPPGDRIASIIRSETGITELIEQAEVLVAFLFQRRRAYARALFPAPAGEEPRDLTLDGLLLELIEALQTATQNDYGNLVKILKEPVGNIKVVAAMPTPPKGVN